MSIPSSADPRNSPTSKQPSPSAPNDEVIVYGTTWCGDCHRSRRFLDRHQVPYRWVDIEHEPAGVGVVLAVNHGKSSVPTIVFPDGSTLTEPSNLELGQKLGLKV